MRYFVLFLFLMSIALTGCTQNPAQSSDALTGDAERGQVIFARGKSGAPACSSCHSITSSGFSFGPAMTGIAERAATRRQGLTAEQYLHESIVTPSDYVVSGYRPIMYPQYAERLSDQDIADVIAYLLTLK